MPVLRAVPSSRPYVDSCFEVEVFGFVPSSQIAVGVLGFSDSSWGGAPLPASLTPLGMPGCTQYVAADAAVVLPANQGRAAWSMSIPDALWLTGFRFYQQALVLDAQANAAGVVATNAGAAVIGGR